MQTLKVKPVGSILVSDIPALLEAHVRRYIGRRLDMTLGGSYIDSVTGQEVRQAGWVPTDEVSEIPNLVEYRKAIKAGDLEAADKETADLCGVPWVAPVFVAKNSRISKE